MLGHEFSRNQWLGREGHAKPLSLVRGEAGQQVSRILAPYVNEILDSLDYACNTLDQPVNCFRSKTGRQPFKCKYKGIHVGGVSSFSSRRRV